MTSQMEIEGNVEGENEEELMRAVITVWCRVRCL